MSLHSTTLFYPYSQTYNDNVSQFIYLQKLAVFPILNVKSHVYLNKSCTTRFCDRGYRLKKNDSNIYFRRITMPAFHSGDLKKSKNYMTTFTDLPKSYRLIH